MLSIVNHYFFAIVLLALLAGCSDRSASVSYRLPLPPYNAEAVITEENYGATTPFVYKLHLCAEGKVVDGSCGEEVLMVDKVDLNEINLKWDDGRLMVSLPDTARIHHFSNFWYSVNEPHRPAVSIELRVMINITNDSE